MEKPGIKVTSGKFVLYLNFALFLPILLILVCGIILALMDWKFNTPFIVFIVVFDIAILAYVLFGTEYLFHKLPYKRSKELVEKQRREGFPFSYYLNYKQDFWIVDEVNGRLAVVTEKNPYSFQIIDAANIERITVFPQSQVKKTVNIGCIISIGGNKYKAYTYNGIGWRYRHYINMDSDMAKECLRLANELSDHINKAKEVAIQNKANYNRS